MSGVALVSGDWDAGLMPAHGGALTGLSHRGVAILRPMPAGHSDPLASACFPLIPYCNRIRDARFEWGGAQVQLPRNFAPERSSLHGIGWQGAWRIENQRDFKCALSNQYDGPGAAPGAEGIVAWPWAYHAQQRVRLGPKGCAMSLDLTNRANTPMPAGLGLHPYFRRRPETRVQFGSTGMLVADDDLIPTGALVAAVHLADWSGGTALPPATVDHCFVGWDGTVRIEDDLGAITMTARGAPYLHVYAPADGSVLCLEPVSHRPDALNQDPAGITALPPGCTASLQMWISAD